MFKTTLLAAAMTATLAAPLAAPSSAKEEGSIVPTFDSVNNVFVDFVLNGCLSSMNGRSPVSGFATERQLFIADETVTSAFLNGHAGKVYVHGGVPVVISALDDGLCSVSARHAPMIAALEQSIDAWLAGPGAPFKKTKTEESGNQSGGTSKMHVYQAEISGHNLFAVLSTTASEDVLAQAVITIGEE